ERAECPLGAEATPAALAVLADELAALGAVRVLLHQHGAAARAELGGLLLEIDRARDLVERRIACEHLLQAVLADRAHPGLDRRLADGMVARIAEHEPANRIVHVQDLEDPGAAVVPGLVAMLAAARAVQRDAALLAACRREAVEARGPGLVRLLAARAQLPHQ